MRKKTYQQPTMKVVKVEQTGIICTSTRQFTPKQGAEKQTESYEEGSVSGWY
ncbi:MAG: hypothetical protein KBT39_10145 [Bacteroidales bacterium]|nr:hypothetical protein [Bacteroidales bacterium]